MKYSKIATTHVVELDPMSLRIAITDKPANQVKLNNYVTSSYQWYIFEGKKIVGSYPLGILVSEGKILANTQPHSKSAGTLIVYKDGSVDVKPIIDIRTEKNVWFAVSGCSILPRIRMKEEGFVGRFADIGRVANRPCIGYNPITNKIIISVRPNSNIGRGQQTLKNLGCTKGITLDAGGSTCLRVNNKTLVSTSRWLYSLITWEV